MSDSSYPPLASTAAAITPDDPGSTTGFPSMPDARDIVDVVLEGGPPDLPTEWRRHQVSAIADKIKVPYHGGHEHFERQTGATIGDSPVVFRWTGRTRIAE